MREATIFEAHSSYVLGLKFTRDSQTLISAGMDNVVKLWSVPEWKHLTTFEAHTKSVNSIALSPDEKKLATGSTDTTVKLWSFPDGQLLHTLQDQKKVVATVKFSPDGQWIAAGSYGGRVKIWSLSGEETISIKASKKNLSSIAFSPDKILATAGLGDNIFLWSMPTGEPIGSLSGHKTAVGSLKFVNGGRYLVSKGYEQTVKFWDTKSWQEARTHQLNSSSARSLLFSPDEKTVAISMESKVELWAVDTWKLQAELPVSTKAVSGMAFSRDGQWLAIGAADKKIRFWEL